MVGKSRNEQMKNQPAKTRRLRSLLALVLFGLTSSLTSVHAWYDPGVQRWVNRDPLGDESRTELNGHRNFIVARIRLSSDRNLYQFVYNSPVGVNDPDGRVPIEGPVVMPGMRGFPQCPAPCGKLCRAACWAAAAAASVLTCPESGPGAAACAAAWAAAASLCSDSCPECP